MFQPPIFKEDRLNIMQDLIRAHPFATLVSSATGELSADHVPLILYTEEAETGILCGHVAVANPLFRRSDGPIKVMAIFQGPQTYITPSWYASKQEHGKVVPTWNYVVVHAHGILSFIRDTDWLMQHLNDLTAQQESSRPNPWAVSDAPDDFVKGQLKGLVGFEIQVESTIGTWKVSQNKNYKDKEGVANGLLSESTNDAEAVARLVKAQH